MGRVLARFPGTDTLARSLTATCKRRCGGHTGPPMDPARLKLWAQKWRWYERNSLPWNRARIHWEMAKREAFVRWPVHGNVLEALREGRLEVGAGN